MVLALEVLLFVATWPSMQDHTLSCSALGLQPCWVCAFL